MNIEQKIILMRKIQRKAGEFLATVFFVGCAILFTLAMIEQLSYLGF